MRDFEEKRKNYTDMLTCQIDGISKILRVNGVKRLYHWRLGMNCQ